MKRKNTLFRKNVLLVCFTLLSLNMFAQSSCEAEMTAFRNTTVKDVSSEGSYYQMMIINKGDSSDIYILTSKDVNDSCSNQDGSSNTNNVVLNYSYLDTDKNPINKISLKAGESFNFLISVTTPSGVSMDRWSCVEIIASSKKCENYSASIILQSFVIDPNEE